MPFPRPRSRLAAAFLALIAAGCSGSSQRSRAYDVERYALDGAFDWDKQRLHATVAITLNLTEGDPGALELDSDVSVSAVRIAGAGPAAFTALPDEGRLLVSLDEAPDTDAGQALTIEIDYEASRSDALRAIPPRAGDHLPTRALFTNSEPLGAQAWMPCNNVPTDRALFSVAMRMDASELMIANGALVDDAEDGAGARRIRYEASYPLPPYLMAFAISDFEVEKSAEQGGGAPISVWHRRGLPGSYGAILAELRRMMTLFEGLLGPYPFEGYSLVLLPSFPGGMENAGVTFQSEAGSTEPSLAPDLTLTAHELSHQWFGDLVTVATWDDVWIKEGMATLLEYEAVRDHLDSSGQGTLHGDELEPEDGVPIRDRRAAPNQKYTSGPYDRAAWLLTQIRSLTGDDAFFAALRGVLERRRFDAIGTDEFIAAFAPALGPEATARALRAVDAKAMPSLIFSDVDEGARVYVDDTEGALVAPMDFAWLSAGGASRSVSFGSNESAIIKPEAGELLLVEDPSDRHPRWTAFPFEDPLSIEGGPFNEPPSSESVYSDRVSGFFLPTTAEALDPFMTLPGPHQRAALDIDSGGSTALLLQPSGFAAFVEALHGDPAKALARRVGCWALASENLDPALHDAWTATLSALLVSSPPPFGLAYTSSYSPCKTLSPETLLAGEFASLASGLPLGDISAPRLTYLFKFAPFSGTALPSWSSVAKIAPSLRTRKIAADLLARRALGGYPPEWRALFLHLARTSEASEVLPAVARGLATASFQLGELDDKESLVALRGLLLEDVTRPAHEAILCWIYSSARRLVAAPDGVGTTLEIAPEWHDFAASLASAPLSTDARWILANPEECF